MCTECAQDRWGTGNNGQGKACRELRRIVLIPRRDESPYILTIPVTSMRAWDNYCTALRSNGKRYYSVITRLTLVQSATAAGRPVVKLQTETLKDLDDRQLEWILEERGRCLALVVRSGVATTEDEDESYEENGGVTPTDGYAQPSFSPDPVVTQVAPQTRPQTAAPEASRRKAPRQEPLPQTEAPKQQTAEPPAFDDSDIPF